MREQPIQAPVPSLDAGVAGPTEYTGNTNDLIALTAAVSGLTLCGYLATNGLLCCLPVALGAAGLALAKDARDPARARNLSLVGIVSVGILVVMLTVCLVAYFGFIAFVSMTSGNGVFDQMRYN